MSSHGWKRCNSMKNFSTHRMTKWLQRNNDSADAPRYKKILAKLEVGANGGRSKQKKQYESKDSKGRW